MGCFSLQGSGSITEEHPEKIKQRGSGVPPHPHGRAWHHCSALKFIKVEITYTRLGLSMVCLGGGGGAL